MARTRDEVQADIDVLVNRLQAGEIDLAEYGKQLGPLMQQINYLIYQETAMPIKTLEEQPEVKSLEAKKQITGMSPYSPIYKYGSQITQEAKREGEDISPEEAFARGKEKFEREILPSRFTTGEYEEVLPGYIGVSDVVDPVKGLIRDPKTGQVRKATQWELVKEIPYRQRKQTKSQQQIVEEKAKASTPEKIIKWALETEVPPTQEDEKRFVLKQEQEDEPVTVVETPLATMLRAGFGTGSAVLAEGVQAVNDMIGWATGAPVSTREGAGYKKTEMDMVGGQMLTNALLGQGIFNQQQAQLLPPDEDYNGLNDYLTDIALLTTMPFAPLYSPSVLKQGTFRSQALGLSGEIAAPLTPLGEFAMIPKLSVGGVLRKGAGSVLDAVKLKGIRSQIDTALNALDESKTVADLEREIYESGQTVTDNTLRAKKAEFAGDTYASSQAIDEAIENAKKSGVDEITKEDINTPDSLVVESMFGNKNSLTLDEVQDKADRLRIRLEETTGVGKRDSTILRNLKDTADEVRKVIQTGEAPQHNASLINRAINTSKMMNFDVWEMAAEGADDATKALLAEGKELIIESSIKPLSPQQMIDLGNIWKELDNKGVWNNIDENVFKTPRHIYTATRNAVAEVAKDNMLRHFTDDLIYVSPRVAVPVKNIHTTLGKKTIQFNAYQKELGDLIDGQILDDGTRALNPENAKNILQYQRKSGLTLPQQVEQKVLETAEGNVVGLTQTEFKVLEQEISSELAMDYLGGVQLRSGALTAMRAEAPLEARTELFASGKNVPSFVIGVKELDNAIRLATQDTAVGKAYLSIRNTFFPITDDLPASYRKFQNEMLQAEQAAVAQVSETLTRGADDPMHFDNVLTDYLRMDEELELQKIKETARTEEALGKVTPETKTDFLGKEINSEKTAAQRQTQLLADKYGRDNINEFMESQGIEPTYENIVDNIAFIEENMDVAMRQIHLKNQWVTVVNDFFQTPVKGGDTVEFSLKRLWINGLTDIIRLDKNAPFWSDNNIMPLTMDNYRIVIEELRNRYEALKGYGLREIKIRPGAERKEMFVLPLYKRMVDIQRKANMQKTIDDFLQNEPDLFVQLGRTSQQAVGLESTQAIANQLSTEILNITSRAVQEGFLTEDAVTVALHNIRQALFDGMMADVWRMSDRGTQETFLQKYMLRMIEQQTPVIDNMDDFVLDMYASGVLQSNTFKKVEAKVQKIIDATHKNIQEIKTARELTTEEAKIVQQLENDLYVVTDMFKDQYLNNLTFRNDGVMDGLFTSQIRAVNDYMSRYGVTSESLVDSINRLAPRIDYMGNKNIALVYGIEHEKNVQKILEMAKDSKTVRFLKDLQEAAATSYAARYTGQYMLEVLSVMRRWAMGEMLGGIVIPSMRFIGMNAFTNPVIFMTTLPSNMRISTLAGFTGHAVGSLVMQAPGVQRLTTKALEVPIIQNIFGKGTKSNRYKIAPDNEIIISRAEGAVRDYTAKELRDLSEYYGIESGYIDAQFQSAQFNRILIGAKKDASGFVREGLWNKVTDNLSPSGANYMTEYSRNQDAQMRRFVFIDSLMNGDTPSMAANKASRSILDYNLLKGAEATTLKKYMWFYSFMRTMGTAVINSVYTAIKTGKTSVPLKFLQMQDRLNRQTMRDYESAQNDTLGRVFGIYMDTVDGTDMYASGMMNPQIQMFDIMSTAGMYMLHAADKLTSDERTMEAKLYEASLIYADLPATGAAIGKKIAKGNPITELLLEMWDAENGRWKPMPSELVYAAEEQGKLPELKKTYGLVERRRTAGRPLSREGVYYDFPKGEEGKRKVRLYLMHRLLGLTAANLIAYPMGYTAAQPRGIKEFWRGQMFAETDTMIPSPTGEGQIPIKDKTAYLKSLNKNNLNDMSSAWFMAYYTGLLTPTKTQSVQRQWEYGLKALERDIKAKE